MAEADADWLPDLAALATLSVAVHYVLGLYGLLGALLLFVLLEHGSSLQMQLQLQLRADKQEPAPSALEDDASTEGDDELLAAPDDVPPEQERDQEQEQHSEEEDEELQRRQRVARRRMASLVVNDVGSAASPPREDMEMNSRTPIAFETELFTGRALFLVRTQPEDPHYVALFAGKRRMFWIQVQGRFKRRRADLSTWAASCRRASRPACSHAAWRWSSWGSSAGSWAA